MAIDPEELKLLLETSGKRASAGQFLKIFERPGKPPLLSRATVYRVWAGKPVFSHTAETARSVISARLAINMNGSPPLLFQDSTGVRSEKFFLNQLEEHYQALRRSSRTPFIWCDDLEHAIDRAFQKNHPSNAVRELAASVYGELAAQYNSYPERGRFSREHALSLLAKALAICPGSSKSVGAAIHHQRGLIHHASCRFAMALPEIQSALDLYESAKDAEGEAATLADLSRLYCSLERKDLAANCAARALTLNDTLCSDKHLFTSNLAYSLAKLNNAEPTRAWDSLAEAERPYKKVNHATLPPLWNYLLLVHRALALTSSGERDKGATELEAALQIAKIEHVPEWQRAATLLQQQIKDPDAALRAYNKNP